MMKILTLNFLTCAIKSCKTSPNSFPLHPRDAELATSELPYNPIFIRNILPRLHWEATLTTATELGFADLPAEKPEGTVADPERKEEGEEDAKVGEMEVERQTALADDEEVLKLLHRVLLETEIMEGKLVCGNCGHEYRVKEGIANFLLPSHLGKFPDFNWSMC